MDEYIEALEIMCNRCMNYPVCNGTGCSPKIKLKELIERTKEKDED